MKATQTLHDLGQSLWLDNITRTMLGDGTLECHEVKGHWEDDARVKIKCAAEKFPFRFVAMKPRTKKNGGGFECEEF